MAYIPKTNLVVPTNSELKQMSKTDADITEFSRLQKILGTTIQTIGESEMVKRCNAAKFDLCQMATISQEPTEKRIEVIKALLTAIGVTY